MAAGSVHAVVLPAQAPQSVEQPTSALYAQGLKLETRARQGLSDMIGLDGGSGADARVTSTGADESNTAVMLFGALAIMAVMVRRRWNGRD